MKKYLLLILLVPVCLSALPDIDKQLQELEPRYQALVENIETPEEARALIDSLIQVNPKDPLYLLLNITLPFPDSVADKKGIEAAELGIKNLPGNYKSLRNLCYYAKARATLSSDSLQAFNLYKHAWTREPWSQGFVEISNLCFDFNDPETLRNLITEAQKRDLVQEGPMRSAKLMLSSLENSDSDIYNTTIAFLKDYSIDPAAEVAFKVLSRSAPEQLKKGFAEIVTKYGAIDKYAAYYLKHREDIDADFQLIRDSKPDNEKWEVDADVIHLLYLAERYPEIWKRLEIMATDAAADTNYVNDGLVAMATQLDYPYELVENSFDIPTENLPDDIAVKRLLALSTGYKNRLEDVKKKASELMFKYPDMAFVAHYALGRAQLNEGNLEAALKEFETSSMYNEDEGLPQLYQAVVLQKLGRGEEAEQLLVDLRQKDGTDMALMDPKTFKALVLAITGNGVDAMGITESQEPKTDYDWQHYTLRALIYYLCNEPAKGKEAMKKASDIYPKAMDYIMLDPLWEPIIMGMQTDGADCNPQN